MYILDVLFMIINENFHRIGENLPMAEEDVIRALQQISCYTNQFMRFLQDGVDNNNLNRNILPYINPLRYLVPITEYYGNPDVFTVGATILVRAAGDAGFSYLLEPLFGVYIGRIQTINPIGQVYQNIGSIVVREFGSPGPGVTYPNLGRITTSFSSLTEHIGGLNLDYLPFVLNFRSTSFGQFINNPAALHDFPEWEVRTVLDLLFSDQIVSHVVSNLPGFIRIILMIIENLPN